MTHITKKRKEVPQDHTSLSCSLVENRLLQTSLLSSITTNSEHLSKFNTDNVFLSSLSLKNTLLTQSAKTHSFSEKPSVLKSFQQKTIDSGVIPLISVDARRKELKEEQEANSMLIDSWAGLATFHSNQDLQEKWSFESSSRNLIYLEKKLHEGLIRRIPDVRETKAAFIQFVASSLLDGGVLKRIPGRHVLVNFLQSLSSSDPEFILKTAVYCRRELNIRTTANAILACACFDKACYPFLDKYFSAVVSLPSDWIEVTEYFKAMTSPDSKRISLPKPMRRNMIAKFLEFDEYQLAKHNKEKARNKRARKLRSSRLAVSPDAPMESTHPFVYMNHASLTLKYLVRVLHIRVPTFPVMCILGKKYPSSATDFVRLGLEGNWDPSLSGTRMKLPTPITWETELSKHGNNSDTWESLIRSGKLPFMAMLRNLRNIIKTGVRWSLQKEVANTLSNPHAVMSSKLFPFRFFTAFVVLDRLKKDYGYFRHIANLLSKHRKDLIKTSTGMIVRTGTKIKLKAKKSLVKLTSFHVKPLQYTPKHIRLYETALGKAIEIAVRNNLPPIRGSTLIICSLCTKKTMQRQLEAAGLGNNLQAVGSLLALMCASVCENSTMYVMLNDMDECYAASDLALAAQNTACGPQRNILEQARRLLQRFKNLPCYSLKRCLEDFVAIGYRFDTVYLIGEMCPSVAKYVSIQRANVGPVNAVWSNLTGTDEWSQDYGDKSDWMIMKGLTDQVLRYIAEASDSGLIDHVERIDELYGLTKPLCVQFPDSTEAAGSDRTEFQVDRPIAVHWRCCRIFVSSTFRDMHAERDLICGLLLPALRQYAARELHVHVLDVDLRWGVPESTTRSSQALEMCLSQAAKCDLFVLLVGNRYGWAPEQALLNTLPKPLLSELSKFYSPGMSITEMEYNIAKRAAQMRVPPGRKRFGPGTERNALRSRVFAFVRDPASLSGIPEEHTLDFTDNDPEKKAKLNTFKSTLRKDGVIVLDNYPAWFNGLIANRPVMGNLTQFGNELKQTLHNALIQLYKPEQPDALAEQSLTLPHRPVPPAEFLRIFVEPVAASIAPRQLFDIERAANALTDRGKQCHSLRLLAAKQTRPSELKINLKQTGSDGAILLITGAAGCGKTTHLASLAMTLHKSHWTPAQDKHSTAGFDTTDPRSILRSGSTATQRPKWPQHQILAYFADGLALTGLAPKTQLVELLNQWTERLFSELELAARVHVSVSKRLEEIRAESLSDAGSVNDSLLRSKMVCLSKLIATLQLFPNRHYAFLLDGADHLKPALFDWLPEVLPSNVRVVLTCDSQSPVAQHFSIRPDCLMFTVSSLSLAERSAAVRAILGRYGKVLDESGFRNQLSLLVNKRSADIPLYLKLACEELRLYGTYEELDAQLKALPDTIPKLVQHIVARAEAHSGSELVLATLALLACSRKPLSTSELHTLLDGWLQDRQCEQLDAVTGKRWRELFNDKSTSVSRVDDLLSLERGIQQLLVEDRMNDSTANSSRRVHIPPLAFHVLLAGIRPLLAGLGDEEEDLASEDDQQQQLVLSGSVDRAVGLLRLRSPEVKAVVQEICFNNRNTRLSASSLLGYHKPTGVAISSSSGAKRLRPTLLSKSDEQRGTKSFSGSIDPKDIYWLLATCSSGLEHKIYYFFHAGRLEIVFRLLLSPAFLMERLQAGQGSLLLEDFQGYATDDSAIQADWRNRLQDRDLADRLSAMRQFIAVHLTILTKYPFLFIELAANYEADPWIRQLGLTQLAAVTDHEMEADSDPIRLLIRRSQMVRGDKDPDMLAPHAIYQPGDEIATAVTLSPNGRLIAYGTRTGVVTLVDAITMREIRSFFGHGSSVLSLCFLADDVQIATNTTLNGGGIETELWLVSTAQDKTICLWLVSAKDQSSSSNLGGGVGSGRQLASWTGPQRQAITCSAWHPKSRLLATGSLDCTLVVWQIPRSIGELESAKSRSGGGSGDGSAVQLERKIIRSFSSPVSSVAFRVPVNVARQPRNEVAVGCWNGTVRIFELDRYKPIITLNVSSVAICSLAYSPSDGGDILATQDIRGQLFLWNGAGYSLLVSIPKTEPLRCDELLIDRTLKPWPLQHGQVCFSKPSGCYLIQSGGPGRYGGQITVWNARLGAQLGPWRDSQPLQLPGKSVQKITACAADPFGRFLLVGGNEGAFNVICAQSGRMLIQQSVLHAIAQQIDDAACVILSPTDATADTPECQVLGVLGYGSGPVQIIKFTVTVNWVAFVRPGETVSAQSRGHRQLTVTNVQIFFFSSLGGTLCVDASARFVAAGGPTGRGLIIFNVADDADMVETILDDLGGSAVTSVAIQGRFVAFGMKNRCVHIYRAEAPDKVTLVTTIHGAANDWITALAWGKLPRRLPGWGKKFLVVGSNDQTVRTYSTTENGDFRQHEILHGPGGHITNLSVVGRFIAATSSDSRIRLWSVKTTLTSDEVTTFDFAGDKTGTGAVGDENLVNVLGASLFFNSVSERKEDENSKSANCLDSGEDGFLHLLEAFFPDESSESDDDSSSPDSDRSSESGNSVESNHVDDAPKPTFNEPLSNWTGREGQQALELGLIVGQQYMAPGANRSKANFRFGTFAPLIPKQRALLQGHPGLIATGLATGAPLSANCEGTLVSIAEPLDTSARAGAVGCDIRLWQLPLFDGDIPGTPIRHNGAITSVCPLFSSEPSSTRWFLSASLDGSVIFWRRGPRAELMNKKQRATSHPVSWMPVFRLICSSLRISTVVAYPALGPLTGYYCVCIGTGRKVWHLCLSESMLSHLELQGTMTLDHLERTTFAGPKPYVSQLQLPHCVKQICRYGDPGVAPVHFIVTNDYEWPEKFTVDFHQSHVSVSWADTLPSEKAPLSSAFSLGRSVYGIDNTNVVSITETTENEMTRLDRKPLFARAVLGSGRLIEPVEPLSADPTSKWFLVASVLEHSSVVQLLDENGRTIARAEPIPAPLTVTALCSLVKPSTTTDATQPCYFAVATSDGFVRLMERKTSESNALIQVGLCPTGERITALQLLDKKPLQLTVGTQSGQVIVYEII